MKKISLPFLISVFSILLTGNLYAGLLINEIACGTSGNDWVEIYFYSEINESRDISNLYVTMYYGTNEKLSNDPVTIYSYDRPETTYDDRFVVVHLTSPGIADETDLTGDTNNNGYLDIYCNNYPSSLWNSDCVVAIDSDDDPANGGIIDFVAYSNRDGTLNSTIESYVNTAQSYNQWASGDAQNCMVFIGNEGLEPFMTISRKSSLDTNSQEDFALTKFMTPGRENLFSSPGSENGNIFSPRKEKIAITPEHFSRGYAEIEVFILESCNIRLRIFSSIGMLIYESRLYENVYPGNFILNWDIKGLGKTAGTGLYIGLIEATSNELRKSQRKKVYMILSRYK